MKTVFYLVALLFQLNANAQDWSSWTSIQSNNSNAVQYCYRLNPVSSGNSFSLKIKNNSLAVVCGEFDVNLNMISGQKKVSYSFKDLKSGIEKSCPGVYQFADVQSFGSITNVKITDCGESNSNSKSSPASFTIDYHNDESKGARLNMLTQKVNSLLRLKLLPVYRKLQIIPTRSRSKTKVLFLRARGK